MVSCSSTFTVSTPPCTCESEALFQWPNHPFADRSVTRVTLSIQTGGTLGGLEVLDPNLRGYDIFVTDSGGWNIGMVTHTSLGLGGRHVVASGTLPSAAPWVLSISVEQSSVTFRANSTALTTLPRTPYFSLANGSVGLEGSIGCGNCGTPTTGVVAFSDFFYQATP
jgi:hypothetical protein